MLSFYFLHLVAIFEADCRHLLFGNSEDRAAEGAEESDEPEGVKLLCRSSSKGRVMVLFPTLCDLYGTMGQLIRYTRLLDYK